MSRKNSREKINRSCAIRETGRELRLGGRMAARRQFQFLLSYFSRLLSNPVFAESGTLGPVFGPAPCVRAGGRANRFLNGSLAVLNCVLGQGRGAFSHFHRLSRDYVKNRLFPPLQERSL
ncbi:MAG: hypothetical protein GC185_01835 [Alphaproteobacteria bacterium]|nr:hypothetical protein [Alphaproteobacteria bacterium]